MRPVEAHPPMININPVKPAVISILFIVVGFWPENHFRPLF
ncbi:hypothetical protein C900_02135 [Fulvivirga imtechensis AK7]|uniref:Uncharacterized protein n=1 Tax=Fulvivirga imtechensis AK7 TaxID=1237149 RepID=L8JSE5_9BACT|nr:hypothetical protein C900_02135 [Fulvivirga imtechensis AK7]